ncbi:hypothetical protein [Olleya sp. R77988]|uniref:hypothetical protein n=1 Tax=Olleya sp. R77988 TaxID=3093875 RepID=UPI0037C886CA
MHGGSSSSVIKNNRNLLKNTNREKFVYSPGKPNKVEKEKFDHLILNTEYHQNIRKRLLSENKKRFYKRLVLFVILFIGLFVWFVSLL